MQTATSKTWRPLAPAAGIRFCSERRSHRILLLLQMLLPQVRSNLPIQLRLSPRQLCQLLDDIESASAMTGMQRLQLHWWCHSVRHQLGMPLPQEAPQNEHFLGCTGFKPPESRSLPCSSCMTH